MSKNGQVLVTALLRLGNRGLAELWNVTESEVSRRLSGERNIPLEDFIKALDEIGAQLVIDDEMRVVHRDELQALNLLAGRYLDRRRKVED